MANGDLDDLLRRAEAAGGMDRIVLRDPIAAHGPVAIARLEPWLMHPVLASFAVVTIMAAGSLGAIAEARAALARARPHVRPFIAADIDNAVASMPGSSRARVSKTRRPPTGSPAEALHALSGLAQKWRDRGSPRQPAFNWRQTDWMAAFPAHREGLGRLPPRLDRMDVRRATEGADQDPERAEFAFLVVKAWGEGNNGYGPTRALESFEFTTGLGERLVTAAQTLRDRGALAAYERMSDGGDCRIFNLGPAFGTKFLFFCQPEGQRPQALIHDKNVAVWLREHAGVSLETDAWSVSRYRDYLTLMHDWAYALECSPDDVELCMFQSMLRPGNHWYDG